MICPESTSRYVAPMGRTTDTPRYLEIFGFPVSLTKATLRAATSRHDISRFSRFRATAGRHFPYAQYKCSTPPLEYLQIPRFIAVMPGRFRMPIIFTKHSLCSLSRGSQSEGGIVFPFIVFPSWTLSTKTWLSVVTF